jgi:glycosyltransferase involved in cell wall biosynthesis
LDEAERIGDCIASVRAQGVPTEIIVVDGGSRDGTPDILAGLEGVKALSASRGRGMQIAAGVNAVSSDVVLTLHADSRLLPGALAALSEALARNPEIVGGSFSAAYDAPGLRYRLIAALNNFRARFLGISFGDQAQFFRHAALADGFPAMRLMEDVELSLRLKEAGPTVHLPQGVVNSTRRWEKRGFAHNALKVVLLTALYLIRRRLGLEKGDGEGYYRRYYGDGTFVNAS